MLYGHSFRLFVVLVALLSILIPFQAHADDKEEVEALVMNFALGFWNQSTEEVLSGLHPDLSKKGTSRNWRRSGKEVMQTLPPDRLEILSTVYNSKGLLTNTPKPHVVVHEITDTFASVELVNNVWFDFFQAVKVNGTWKLVNCVYGSGKEYPKPKAKEDELAINNLLKAYIDGLAGDADKLNKALHVNLERRELQLHKKSGKHYINPLAREQLILDSGHMGVDAEKVEVTVHNYTNQVAAARLNYQGKQEQLQLLKISGVWYIVNSFVNN